MIPIIFSHGLTACRGLYTNICSELASYGYMVFALDHHDGSCCYTHDWSGQKSWSFKGDMPFFSFEDMSKRELIRETEISELIDEMFEAEFLQKVLGF